MLDEPNWLATPWTLVSLRRRSRARQIAIWFIIQTTRRRPHTLTLPILPRHSRSNRSNRSNKHNSRCTYPSRPRPTRMRRLDAIRSSHRPRITHGSAVMAHLKARRKHTTREAAAGEAQVCTTPDHFLEVSQHVALAWTSPDTHVLRAGACLRPRWHNSHGWVGYTETWRREAETAARTRRAQRCKHLHICCRTRRLRPPQDLSCGLNFELLHTSPPVAKPSCSSPVYLPMVS